MHDLWRLIKTEIRGAWRYRWVAMAVAWVVCLLGWWFVYDVPNIYEARAKVYVDAQSRLAKVMGQVGVAPGVGGQVFVVRQAMVGRAELEKVATETGLDARAETPEEWDELIIGMRERVSVVQGRRNQARNLYTIRFTDRDRGIAIAVVDSLLNTFVEDVLELKGQGADDAVGYLDEQISYYGDLLSESDLELADFKKRNIGLLPGDREGIFERLQNRMNLVKQLRADLAIERGRERELRRQLGGETPYLQDSGDAKIGVGLPGSVTAGTIKNLEDRRGQLLLVYTEAHPDVIAVQEQLAQLYLQAEAERAALADSGTGMEGVMNATNPVYQTTQIALNESGVLSAGLNGQIRQHEIAIAQLQSQVDTIPQIEAEFRRLTRNYAQYKELHNEIVIRKERERMGQAGSARDVVAFNIIEPPAASPEPISPKRALLLIGVLILGLSAGGGIAIILHQLNPVFYDRRALNDVTGYPVIGAISMTWTDIQKRQRSIGLGSVAVATCGLLLIFGATLVYQDVGPEFVQQLFTTAIQ